MDAVLLARIQFALTIGFHFLFPAMTLGTALIILITESIFLIKKDEDYKKITETSRQAIGRDIRRRRRFRDYHGILLRQ